MTGRLAELWRLLPRTARRTLGTLTLLSTLAAAAELATFGALASFLTRLDEPGPALARAAGLFAAAALVSAGLRLWLNARTVRLSSDVAHQLSVETQRRLIHQPLAFHATFNSARALAMLDKVQLLSSGVLRPLVSLAQGALIGGAILVALLLSTPAAAIAVGALIALTYVAVARLSWKRIEAAQPALSEGFDQRAQAIQENFAGIRDVILDQLQDRRTESFAAIDGRLQSSIASVQALGSAPRYLVEGAGMALLGLLVLILSGRGLDVMIPALGLVAFAALRLLPLANAAYGSWQSWTANRTVIDEVMRVLALPVTPAAKAEPLPFTASVALEKMSFAYPGGPVVLDGVTLDLPKGSRTGVVGITGSGKSTLGDLFMGLIAPVSGKLLVDGTAVAPADRPRWQRNVAHVGQQLFLLDASVAENVAFGQPEPDGERVAAALRAACLDEFVERMDEEVGERGVRLSGGQRQRLGLARAFYKRAPFLVLDEATNALDADTEARVLAQLDPGQTILVISHRPGALAICDRIFDLNDGQLLKRP